MKTRKTYALLLPLMVASPVVAVDTSQTYNSGILVVGFLGFCALILIVQLLPALMMLLGWIRELLRGSAAGEKKKVKSP